MNRAPMTKLPRRNGLVVGVLLLGMTFGLGIGATARADEPADFYRGKTMYMLVGVAVGGEYDTVARLVARHIPNHIPGAPNMITQNMVGASGLKMANHLYTNAPQDGTYIGMMSNELPMSEAFGSEGIQFKAANFHWIGSVAPLVEVLVVNAKTGAKTLEDARRRELTVGTPTRSSIHNYLTGILNRYAGTKLRMVTGYTGGSATDLAMERGEVDGRVVGWSAIKVTKSDWIEGGTINVLAQFGPVAPDLPGVPTAIDLAKNDTDRKVIELLISSTRLGRPLAVGPGVPHDRVETLRTAFRKTVADPNFLSDAKNIKLEVSLVSGEEMQDVVQHVLATPKNIVDLAKSVNQ